MWRKFVWIFSVLSLFVFSNYFTYIIAYNDGLEYGVAHNVEQYNLDVFLKVLSHEKSDFNNALEKSLEFEGGYSNNKNDLGGETIFGISRNNFPKEDIWKVVDRLKRIYSIHGHMNATNKKSVILSKGITTNKKYVSLVHDFYKKSFWDKLQLTEVPKELAELVFDMTINMGSTNTIKYLQKLLNAMNNKNKLYTGSIDEDGVFGTQTQIALSKAINLNYVKHLVIGLKSLRGSHYINIANNRHKNKEFTIGWLNRI